MSSRSGKPSENESVENNPVVISPDVCLADISRGGGNNTGNALVGNFKPVRVPGADAAMIKEMNL